MSLTICAHSPDNNNNNEKCYKKYDKMCSTHNKSLKWYYIFFPRVLNLFMSAIILFYLYCHCIHYNNNNSNNNGEQRRHTQVLQSDFVVKICFHSLLLPDGATGVLGTMMTKPNMLGVYGREGRRIDVVGDSICQQARSCWDNGLDTVELQTLPIRKRAPNSWL